MAIISKGNNKMGKIPNISLPPIVTCNGCEGTCAGKCYAMKFYRIYPLAKKAWDSNLAEWQEDSTAYFSSITSQLNQLRPKFFRWHVGGDIPSYSYFRGIMVVANTMPTTKFLVFTKQYNFVNWAVDNGVLIPSNLQIVFSAWPGMEVTNPFHFKVAWMQDGHETRVPESAFECAGSCTECAACFSLDKIDRDVVFHIH